MSGRLEKFGMAGCWRVSRTGYLGLLPTLFASNHRLTSFESSLPLHPSASADQVFTELPVRLFKNLTSLALRDVERSLNDPIFMKLVEACGNLKKLTIVGAVQLTEPTFIKGIAKMELEVLGMPGAKRLGDEALLSLVKSASNQTLVELDVSSWLISDHGLFRALENGSHPFPNLSTLKMVDIVESSFSFHGIFAVARACQGLEVLDVSGCTDLNDEEAGHAALAGPPGQGDEVVELGVGAGVAAEIDENGQGGEQLAQAEPVGTGLPGADRVSLPTPTPVTDAFVQSLLSVPEHPIGAAKISGSLRWYCLLKGDKLRRVVDEGVRRRGGLVGVAAG